MSSTDRVTLTDLASGGARPRCDTGAATAGGVKMYRRFKDEP